MSPDWDHHLAAAGAQRTAFPFRLPALQSPSPAGMLRDQATGPAAAGAGAGCSNSWGPPTPGRSSALWAARSSVPSGQAFFARPLTRRPQSSPSFQLEALRSLVAAGGGGRPLSVFQRSPSVGEATPQRNARSRQRDATRHAGHGGGLVLAAPVPKTHHHQPPLPPSQIGARDGSVATSVNIRRTVDEMTVEEVSEAMKDLLNGNIRSVAAKIERLQRPPPPPPESRRADESANSNDGEGLPPTARYEEDLSGEMIYVATL